MNHRVPLALMLVAGLLLPACHASYPHGSVEQAVVSLCEKEYGVRVQVKSVNRTVGALIVARNILTKDLTLSDAALNKVENVMLTTSRVTLSSEFKYDFFVISVLDPSTGVQVSFVRYIKDIRRLITDDISRNEYFQRMLIEVETRPLTPGYEFDYDLKDYSLDDFLARQMAERLRLQFQSSLIVEKLFGISAIQGSWQPGRRPEDGYFRMTLHFLPGEPDFNRQGTPELHKDFLKLVAQTAGPILRHYDYANFSGMEITDNSSQQLAFLDRQEFSRETPLSTLMELIKSIKKK